MSMTTYYTGRVAKLCNLLSKPELNGIYVIVELFNLETNRHTVRTLVTLNKVDIVSLSVKTNCLDFVASEGFISMHPCVPIVPMHSSYRTEPSPCVFDVGGYYFEGRLIIEQSMIMRGVTRLYAGSLGPRTTLVCDLYIQPDVDDSPVEFEDIHFAPKGQKGIHGVSGRAIIFRRCTFAGSAVGISIGFGEKAVKIVFESCIFEDSERYGIFIKKNAEVTLLNCIFRNLECSVFAGPGSSVTMIHTTITKTTENGLVMAGKTGSLVMINCSLVACSGFGIMIDDGCDAMIRGCFLHRCTKSSIVVSGGPMTTALIEDTVITECGNGVSLEGDSLHVRMKRMEISHCTGSGVCVAKDTNGDIEVTDCNVHSNRVGNIMNAAVSVRNFLVNGICQSVNATSNYMPRSPERQRKFDKIVEFQREGREKTPLKTRRQWKGIKGLNLVVCGYCLVEEQNKEKLKRCGKCREMVYCSRECQVAHWEEHKTVCCAKSASISEV